MSLINTHLGRSYHLIRQIGSGGTGTLYLAQDTRVSRPVAVKVVAVDDALQQNSLAAQRVKKLFHEKMLAITQLDHPAILPVLDAGQYEIDTSIYFYVAMEHRPGGSLADWFSQAARANVPLTVSDIARFLSQAASALQYAHEHGVIHQDVKPSNFLVSTPASQPDRPHAFPIFQLADFGLAYFFATLSSRGLSQSPHIRGTSMFIAPEQWDGQSVPASDQYALAILAFRLLTGQFPFQGSLGQLIRQHHTAQPPALTRLNPQLDPSIEPVIARALAKLPEQRFPSILDFAQAFASIQSLSADQQHFQPRISSQSLPAREPVPSALLTPADGPAHSEVFAVASTRRAQVSLDAMPGPAPVSADEQIAESLTFTPPQSSSAATGDLPALLTHTSPSVSVQTSTRPAINAGQENDPKRSSSTTSDSSLPAIAPLPGDGRTTIRPGHSSALRKSLLIALVVLAVLTGSGTLLFRSSASSGITWKGVNTTSAAPEQPTTNGNLSMTTPSRTPSTPPTHLKAVAGNGKVALSWTAPGPGLWYWVYSRNVTAGQAHYTRTTYPVTSGTTITMYYLTNGDIYKFYVTAINAAGESPPSNTVQATPFVPLPGIPTHLVAVAGNGKVTLSWRAPGPDLWYWIYYRDVTTGQIHYTRSIYPVTTGTSFTLSYLSNGDTYKFYVTSTNSRGESPPSNTALATPMPLLPLAPTGLRASGNHNGSITLSWRAPGPNLWYWIYYRDVTTGQAHYTRATYPVTTGTSFTLSYLTPNDTYKFYVTAINLAGESPASNTAQATA